MTAPAPWMHIPGRGVQTPKPSVSVSHRISAQDMGRQALEDIVALSAHAEAAEVSQLGGKGMARFM